MKSPRIALIHATPLAVEPITNAFRRLWPEARITNLLEDSLAPDLAAAGQLQPEMIERFQTLSRYVHGCGADAILFTCSAFGPAIEAVASTLPIPALKPNEAMLDAALAVGHTIGLLATFEPSIPALRTELEIMATAQERAIHIVPVAIPDALIAIQQGNAALHDQLIANAATTLTQCDVLVLGQFSMASAARLIPARPDCSVLTSPDSAVQRLKDLFKP